MSDERKFYMEAVAERLRGITRQLQDTLEHWDVLTKEERFDQLEAVVSGLADAVTGAMSWRWIAKHINGIDEFEKD